MSLHRFAFQAMAAVNEVQVHAPDFPDGARGHGRGRGAIGRMHLHLVGGRHRMERVAVQRHGAQNVCETVSNP